MKRTPSQWPCLHYIHRARRAGKTDIRCMLSKLSSSASLPAYAADIPEMWRETTAFGGAQCAASPLLACPCCDGVVHVLSTGNGALMPVDQLNVAAHLQQAVMCLCAAFNDTGQQLAVLASDGTVLGYDVATWHPAFQVSAPSGAMDARWLGVWACHCFAPLAPAALRPAGHFHVSQRATCLSLATTAAKRWRVCSHRACVLRACVLAHYSD
jgi:hypothetical protein